MTPVQAGTWTAVGTLALAAMTLLALATTIVITVRDRKRAAADLAIERVLADGRIRDERDHAQDVRRRERRADSARAHPADRGSAAIPRHRAGNVDQVLPGCPVWAHHAARWRRRVPGGDQIPPAWSAGRRSVPRGRQRS